MLRLAIEAITIAPVEVPERLTYIHVQWRSGAVDELTVARPRTTRTPPEIVDRIGELAALGMQDQAVAVRLNEEKLVPETLRPWTANTVKKVRLEHTQFGKTRTEMLASRCLIGILTGAARSPVP